MDAFSNPDTERIVLCFAAQSGKTEAILNCLGYVADQDPGPAMLVYPSERDARKTMRNRIHPMLEASPALSAHLTGNSDDLGLDEIRLDTTSIYSAWANSPSALASTPVRYVLCDEVDKYPPFSGREASPVKLAEVRTRTYRGLRKIVVSSTPTLEEGAIWQEFLRSSRQEFWVPCPHCGTYQFLDFFAGLKWEKKIPPERVRQENLAWYECRTCGERIEEGRKIWMLGRGVWAPRDAEISIEGKLLSEPPHPRVQGFHLPVLYSPWETWGGAAAEWLESFSERGAAMSFTNSWLALPWREKIESVEVATLKARRKGYTAGTVPEGVLVLTAGADVQADHFYFVVRGWGVGERSWLIRWGTVPTWEALAAAIHAEYERVTGGGTMRVRTALVDSGFRTEEVYRFCRAHRPVAWPTKGSNNPTMMASVRLSKPEAGTILYSFKADFWKDKLSRLIHGASDPQSWALWNLPREVDDVYLEQMSAERRVLLRQKGRLVSHWEPRSESAPNHYFDAEVLATLAADREGVRYLGEVRPAPPPKPRSPGVPGEDWLEGTGLLEGGDFWA